MSWRLLIAALIAVVAGRGAETGPLSKLYVVSAFFSDNGAAFYYRVLDVKADGQNSVVRSSRVATVNLYCPRMIVQSVEAKLPHSPSELVRSSNPCTVKPNDLDAAVKKYSGQLIFNLTGSSCCRSKSVGWPPTLSRATPCLAATGVSLGHAQACATFSGARRRGRVPARGRGAGRRDRSCPEIQDQATSKRRRP